MVREHAGGLAAALVRLPGDFAAAEDLVQDASRGGLAALAGRGHSRAARRLAGHRRPQPRTRYPAPCRASYRAKLGPAAVAGPRRAGRPASADLYLLPPGAPGRAQVALTLRVVCGLTTAQIARAFLVSEADGRPADYPGEAKNHRAGIPYRVRSDDELQARA